MSRRRPASATLIALASLAAGCTIYHTAPPPDEPEPEAWGPPSTASGRTTDPGPIVIQGPPRDAPVVAPPAPVSTATTGDLDTGRRSPDERARAGELEVLRDGRFVVLSDTGLPEEKARRLVARLKEASAFVERELKWQDPRRGLEEIELHVLKADRMKEQYRSALGIASGRHSVIMADDFLDEERSERTLAHELTHVQDRQHLEGGHFPHYILEGRAIVVGRAFGKSLEIEPDAYDERLARTIAGVTAAEARRILQDQAYLSEAKMEHVASMEAVGFFFIEFVRVRRERRLGSLASRLSQVVDLVGEGTRLETAWSLELEESLAASQSAFLAHMQRTEGDPAARFKDTVLEGASHALVPAPQVPAPPASGKP